MCKLLDEHEQQQRYQDLVDRAAVAFDSKLWNGEGRHCEYDSSVLNH